MFYGVDYKYSVFCACVLGGYLWVKMVKGGFFEEVGFYLGF